jgi:hypothetical protein
MVMDKMTRYSFIPEMLSDLTQVGNRPFLSILLSKGTTDGAGFSLATMAGSALGLLNISLIAVSPTALLAAPDMTTGFRATGVGGGNTSGTTSTVVSGVTEMALAGAGAVSAAATDGSVAADSGATGIGVLTGSSL